MQSVQDGGGSALGDVGEFALLARHVLDRIPSGLVALAPDRRILFVNAAARAILGLDELTLELTAESCIRLDAEEQTRLALMLQGKFPGPLRLRSRAGPGMLVTLESIETEATLLSIVPAPGGVPAHTSRDALTGLADRQGFHDRLTALCGTSVALGIAVLRVDVTPPHDRNGDEALVVQVAQRLRSIFRDADIIGRLGLGSFAVAMAALPEVPSLAERLVAALVLPFAPSGTAPQVRIGLAFAPQHGATADDLLRAADRALDAAPKTVGGAVRVYGDDLDLRTRTRHGLAEELRRAIPLQQLELYFQPQLAFDGGGLIGFEALLRWHHPRRGLLHPAEFVPLAEEMGLAQPLGEWTLHEACRQAASWSSRLSIAVNLSPKLLERDRLPRLIATILEQTELPPQRLVLELDERGFQRDPDAPRMLAPIRNSGVRVALDGFGNGSMTLAALSRLPCDILKLDRAIVGEIGRSDEARVITEAAAATARCLGLFAVAVGIETAEQEATCRAAGFDAFQGFLIAEPVPAAETGGLIRAWKRRSAAPTQPR